jgi:hypothetical protein
MFSATLGLARGPVASARTRIIRWPSWVLMCCYTPWKLKRCADILRDAFSFKHVDAGDGWLIFRLPPAELAVHPDGGADIPRGASATSSL